LRAVFRLPRPHRSFFMTTTHCITETSLVTTALDKVRRSVWQDLRKLPDQQAARRFQGEVFLTLR
ncbi:hypothetical protein, partial [Mycobacterium helveticum]|uniref:hypothetical protein n=1 Tax=Mycobacterium helveticum TaxID=2592811 RepID=UPI001AEFEFCB